MIMDKTLNEANGSYFMGKNLIQMAEPFAKEKLELELEKDNKVKEEARKLKYELELEKQKELEARIQTLEMLPMGNKVILLPYPSNPYKKTLSQGGLFIGEYKGQFLNPDSGENDNLKELVACAKVIEVGPDCKFVKPNDDVFYDTRTVYPIPFMSLGYILTSEPQILCFLNDKLKERLNME
jgi:hypothetical protein